jgi:hypothetical protein
MGRFVWGVVLNSSKDITSSSSWSTFEGLELHGEDKGGDDPWGPWEEENNIRIIN